MGKCKELTKEAVTQAALTRYKKMFRDKPADKRFLAEQIYPTAAFLRGMTVELMEQVKKQGAIAEQVNGNGFTKTDTTPAYKELKDTVKTLSTCITTLGGLCPELKKELKSESDDLLTFIGAKK